MKHIENCISLIISFLMLTTKSWAESVGLPKSTSVLHVGLGISLTAGILLLGGLAIRRRTSLRGKLLSVETIQEKILF